MPQLRFIPVDSVAAAFAWLADWLPAADDALTRSATILCSSIRAHALRRAVAVENGEVGRLAGVRFVDAAVFAREILARAGEPRRPGWEEVRRLRIHQCFATGELRGNLQYFNADQLRSGRGYADAFSQVIADLEQSGLDSQTALAASGELAATDAISAHRLHDVAAVWTAVDAGQEDRRTVAQLLVDAAAVLQRSHQAAGIFGPVTAFLTAAPSAVLLQMLAALPDCTFLLLDARPLRTGTQRWRARLSPPQRRRANGNPSTPPGQLALPLSNRSPEIVELELARRYLFAPSEEVADPTRPRSAGPDGSVDIEEYPSIEDEIDAAALWVDEQVAAGTPLEQIAVVVPALDPHARLLIDRLSRPAAPASRDAADMLRQGERSKIKQREPEAEPVEGDGGGFRNAAAGSLAVPVYVAGGLPLADSPAGLRLCALLQALTSGLEAEATIAILPALKPADEETRPRMSPSRAAEIVYGAGIVGGTPGDRAGALEWLPRLQQRRDALLRVLGELPESDGDEPEKRRHLYTRRDIERWRAEVEPLLSAVEALQHIAAAILQGRSLRDLWPLIREFATERLRVPPDPVNWLNLIEDRLATVLADRIGETVVGFDALTYLIEVLARARVPHGRFGEPRVFVGTPEHAAGLPFRAVRVTGLAEGILPRTPHDDPIVPNDARLQIEEHLRLRHPEIVITRLEDRVLEDLHGFFRIVGATSERLALSASRQWVDRSEREVSGLMLEVAAALGRRESAEEGDVPTASRLRSAYYGPGRSARAAHAGSSLHPRAVLSHAPNMAADGLHVPAGWCAGSAMRLDRVQEIAAETEAEAFTPADGQVGASWRAVVAPGLVPERPISASALATLLGCPHRFLLQNILHLDEPAGRPSTDTIDARAYGSLFHAVAEAFFRAHGAAICSHEGTVEQWQARARQIAAKKFDEWRAEYPLRGEDSVARERQRLVRQVEQLVDIEWQKPRREFIATELSFGDPRAVELSVTGGTLYVAGQIDRVDRLRPAGLSVRDLKTGRVHDLGEEPLNAGRDLQIGLYTLALESPASSTEKVTHAAYVHPSAAQDPERSFEQSELKALRERTREWLGVARGLLAIGSFPRTPLASDCVYCPFRPACGEGAQEQSAAKLATGPLSPELEAFVKLKEEGQGEDTGG